MTIRDLISGLACVFIEITIVDYILVPYFHLDPSRIALSVALASVAFSKDN